MALTNKLKALVVDDEPNINNLLKINLEKMNFTVDSFFDAESALTSLQSKQYDLCLLDWMLPGEQGISLVKKIRHSLKSEVKIMMITAKADADSIVAGLDAGADDYLVKPFDSKVLSARVRNLTRQNIVGSESQSGSVLQLDSLVVDFEKYTVLYQDNEVKLTLSEFKILSILLKANGKVLSRDQLICLVQGEDVAVTTRTIDTHMFALRKKIGTWSKHIETVRGVGYRILISSDDSSELDLEK